MKDLKAIENRIPALQRARDKHTLLLDFLPFLVGVSTIGVTLAVALQLKARGEAYERAQFEDLVGRFDRKFRRRLDEIASRVIAAAALHKASASVTDSEWNAFTKELLEFGDARGILGLGHQTIGTTPVVSRFTWSRDEAHGAPPPRIAFPVPAQGSSKHALRLVSQDSPAASAVRLSHAFAHPIFPPAATDTPHQGVRVPSAWVYAPFDIHEVMPSVLKDQVENLDISLFDESPSRPTDRARSREIFRFDNGKPRVDDVTFSKTKAYDFHGATWKVQFTAHRGFVASYSSDSILVLLLSGLGVAFLLTILMRHAADRRAQRDVKRERNVLKALVRHSPVNVAMFDSQMRYVEVSDQWARAGGMESAEAMLGRNHYELFPSQTKNRAMHARALAGETLQCAEDSARLPNGETVHFRWTMQPWRLDDASIGGIFITTVDVGDLVRAREEALSHARMKSEFLATMSHELRTPLNGILGMSHLLGMSRLDAHQAEQVALLEQSCRVLLNVVNDILDHSKLESGKFEPDLHPFALAAALSAPFELLRKGAGSGAIAFAADISGLEETVVIGDELRISQVILNLLSNAIKFTSRGRVTLRARLTERVEAAGTAVLVVSVEDTGIGMDESTLARIFSPFTQADSSTSRRFGGTGLGLSICKRLVDAMHGRIWAESTPGVGSTFHFSLPLSIVPKKAAADQTSDSGTAAMTDTSDGADATPVRESTVPPAHAPSLLVAEDNAVNQIVITQLLRKAGHEPTLVDNGLAVVEILASRQFDLLFLDCHMPGLDGFKAAERIRESEARTGRRRIRIVALTASADDEVRDRCQRAGMDDFLSKPIVWKELERCLSSLAAPASAHPDQAQTDLHSSIQGLETLLGAETLVSVLEEFVRGFPALLKDFEEAFRTNQSDRLVRTAHALKSNSAMFGLKALESACAEMEMRARTMNPSELEREFAELLVHVERALDLMNTQVLPSRRSARAKRAQA